MNYKSLSNFFMAGLLNIRVFAKNLMRGNRPRNIFLRPISRVDYNSYWTTMAVLVRLVVRILRCATETFISNYSHATFYYGLVCAELAY